MQSLRDLYGGIRNPQALLFLSCDNGDRSVSGTVLSDTFRYRCELSHYSTL